MINIKSVDANQLKEWLDNQEVIVVDVREQHEFDTARIPDSKLIPVGSIDLSKLPDAKGKKIVIHCQLGKRGSLACEKLLLSKPDLEIYNLEGGLNAWRDAGFKVLHGTTENKQTYSLEQQTYLSIGTGVLTGLILGYFIHPAFLLVSAFFAGGLIYAGLTGSCTLTKIISKMPWNKK